MNTIVPILGLWTAAALAQSFTPPLAGIARDSRNQVRRIYGVAGSFIVSRTPLAEARSAAFSGRFGLLKTEDAVVTINEDGEVLGSAAAPEGDALFAFDARGFPALAYFPATLELRELKPDGETRRLALDGVLSISPTGVLLLRDRRLWRLANGGMAPVSADEFDEPPPALLLADGTVIYASGATLVIATLDGSERRLTLGEPCRRLEQMAADWVLARPATALHLEHLRTYRLPDVAP
jgi:hypothetical protein